jgi:hypothetical protein
MNAHFLHEALHYILGGLSGAGIAMVFVIRRLRKDAGL